VIEGYVGRPGSGKSYTLTARAWEEAEQGRQVFANFGLRHPNVERISIDDLVDPSMPPGLVVIDEAHLWFPSRLSMKLPPSLLMRLSQTRKAGWDLLWAAQHESRVDRVLRDVSGWMWLCSAWKGLNPFSDPSHPAYFVALCYEPEKFRKRKQHAQRSVRRFSQRVADAYDTHETLAVADHVMAVQDHYRKGSDDGDSVARPRRRARLGVVEEPAAGHGG